MDISDLKKALHVALSENIQTSAKALHMTPGALSKTIKRVETQIQTPLFERVGRGIRLNDQGRHFIHYAQHLVHEFEQMTSHFGQSQQSTAVTISGPPILLNYFVPQVLPEAMREQLTVQIQGVFEGEALSQLNHGTCHLALVTAEAIDNQRHYQTSTLNHAQFSLAQAAKKPLLDPTLPSDALAKAIGQVPFVCPSSSPFCGIKRGIGSDGWQDDLLPRHIRYRSNDHATLITLVKQGLAIAYLPDFVIAQENLAPIETTLPFSTRETVLLAWKPSLAEGWLNRLVAMI